MKKERILKYLILMGVIVLSFFIFTSKEVNAVDYSVNDKITLQLEQVDSGDITKGYEIVGATTTCQTSSCVTNWEMPSVYDDNDPGTEDYPIVSIKDSDNNQTSVLSAISKFVSGEITIGENIEKLGTCAFCDFSYVKSYVVGEKVTSIGKYSFAYNHSLEVVEIKAFNNSVRSSLVLDDEGNVTTFLSPNNLSKIVFKNQTIANTYKNSVNGWDKVDVPFTFKVIYRFYNEERTSFDSLNTYYGEVIGNVPLAINKSGFVFSWVSDHYDTVIDSNSISTFHPEESLEGGIYYHNVVPSWSLKNANLSLDATFDGSSTSFEEAQNELEIMYGGKNKKLELEVIIEHELLSQLEITYSWTRNISGVNDISFYLNTSNAIVFGVADTGTYTCEVTMKYQSHKIIQSIEIDLNIQKKPLVINLKNAESEYGYFVEAVDDFNGEYYEIDESTPLIQNEKIEEFIFLGYNEKVEVGSYENVLKGEVVRIGYDGDSINYVDNYNISYNYSDLTVTPRKLELNLSENIELEYGEEENFLKKVNVEIYEEQKELNVDLIRIDVSNKNVGSYDIVAANVIDNDAIDQNYSITIADESVGKIIVIPKKVNVDWKIDNNLVYSGGEKEVSASYKTNDNKDVELNVEITKDDVSNVLVNAGSYDLTASMKMVDGNYELVNFTKIVEIEKADSVFIGSTRQTTTYNGLPQRVEVSLNHSEGTIVYGDYSTCKNAHLSTSSTCTISVSSSATENYKAVSGNFYLHINPYYINVEPSVYELSYGNTIDRYTFSSKYEGVNGENVIVYFNMRATNDPILPVGSYDIIGVTLSNNTNYRVTMVANSGVGKVKVVPAPVEIEFYFYENLVYDGKVKNIGIRPTGTLDDVGLVVDYGETTVIKDAGDYRIEVSVTNSNYYIKGNDYLEFSIAKADYDLSNIKFTSKKVKFNFGSHFIGLDGELPNGLTAVYTIDGNKGNGTSLPFKHKVKVSFEGDFENYNYVEPLVATLNVDMTWVWITLVGVILLGVVVPVGLVLLIKFNIIKIKKRVRIHGIRKLLKRSKEIDELYQMFKEKREAFNNSEQEEQIVLEDSVKFVKTTDRRRIENTISPAFVDELFKVDYTIKHLYSEVKNELLSYEGITSKIKREYETFYLNNTVIARLDIEKGVFCAYFALDPTQYKSEEYNHENVSKQKEFAIVPLKLNIDSVISLRHAKMFIRIIRKREGIKSVSNFVRIDYANVYTVKENPLKLFKKAFVKRGTKEYEED